MNEFSVWPNLERRAVYYQFEAPGLFLSLNHVNVEKNAGIRCRKGGCVMSLTLFALVVMLGTPIYQNVQPRKYTYAKAILVSLKENETAPNCGRNSSGKSYFSYYFHQVPANFECTQAEEIQDSTVIPASFNDALWVLSSSRIDDCCYSYYFTAKESSSSSSVVTCNVSSRTRFTLHTGEDCVII